jgi:NADH-quinone oxidoreductase subunit F
MLKEKEYAIRVCMGTGGVTAGGEKVLDAFRSQLSSFGLTVPVDECIKKVGCRGFCARDVLVDIQSKEDLHTYQYVDPEMVTRIVEEHLMQGKPVKEWLVGPDYHNFHEKQKKIVLRHCGRIDPENIEEYITLKGYEGAAKALTGMNRLEVIDEVRASGLRGRGGAGFSTGVKWNLCNISPGIPKYIICNADEGDPGAFMDRAIIEGNPHSVLEGMIIGGYAIGANQGYIYIRAEYPLAIHRLIIAIKQAEEKGFLGNDIFGSGFAFDVKIKKGAGAFICGEETALIASIEGKRGIPKARPPFPVNKGLWGKPTTINNVETFANVPPIIRKGSSWFAAIGTEKSGGTKAFSLTGKVKNTGLIEVPMGISLKEIVYEIGGGPPKNRTLKAVQTGGPSGGCIPAAYLDTPVDYDSLVKLGSMMGSGGMVVMDDTTCMVDMAKFFLTFTQTESCGKCVPCRIGTKRMLEILTRITAGKGKESDIDLLDELAWDIKDASLCGLGMSAPNPVLSTIRYFRREYEAHIIEGRCPATVCEALRQYVVMDDVCKKCGKCKRVCPSGAIDWEAKATAYINRDKCIKCGACFDACPFRSIV